MERQPNPTDSLENEAEAEFFLLYHLVHVAGSLATHCERVENNEVSSVEDVELVAEHLFDTAFNLAQHAGVDLDIIYMDKIREIEASSLRSQIQPAILNRPSVEPPLTWQAMQIKQIEHNRIFNSDVVGRAGYDQLRLHALQLTRLLGSLWETRYSGLAGYARHTGDITMLALNLSILQNMDLPEQPVSEGPSWLQQPFPET